jgi:hypothetical protein
MPDVTMQTNRSRTIPSSAPAQGFAVRPEHVAAQAAAVLQKSRASVVGIQVSSPWAGGDHITVGEERWPVAYCASALAVREALADHGEEEGAPLIVLTPVPEDQLGWDVRVRLAKGRLIAMEPWGILLDLFRARSVDPRIARLGWMAEMLLEHMPVGGYPPAPSGVLDADTAWAHVLGATLGLRTGRPDAGALLLWSADPAANARFDALSEEARTAFCRRVEATAGRFGALLADTLEAGNGRLLIPIGLVCEVLYPVDDRTSTELERAAVRLEKYMNDRALEPAIAQRWFAAAARVIDRLAPAQANLAFQQAEKLLADLRADASIGTSSILPLAFTRRLEALGQAIVGYLDRQATVGEAVDAHDAVAAHRDAAREPERLERLAMALRLVRFLEQHRTAGPVASMSLAALAQAYAADSGYADWARTLLLGGEQEPELSEAFDALFAKVREVREQENQRFGAALGAWSRLPNAEPGAVAVERALEAVVAPVAASEPVLVLLVDGLDFVIFRQLLRDLRERGWEQWVPEGTEAPSVGVAVVPSVTGFSRTSFFAGEVVAGAAHDEKRRFASHPALAAVSKPKRMPRLFHKGELTGDGAGGLAEEVRSAIRDPEQRVVGAVLNAVDDFLAKSDQVRPRWSIDQIALLYPILYEANLAGRVVVLASDHGHVLEAGTSTLSGGSEERWRSFSEPLADTETVVEGPRVAAATGSPKVVVPWSEAVRYTRKKAGYHGGATPQETIVPLAVLAPWDRPLQGWQALPDHTPAWWSEPEPEPIATPAPEPAPKTRGRARATAQPSLFAEPQKAATPAVAVPSWVSALLHSETYRAQRERAGRIAPPDETVRQLLETLEQHRGRAPRAALARAVGQPEIRLRGILAGLQRVLNVEGYPIISVDEATGTVELQRDLLRKQFQIGA